ncbi:MAG: molybdopterin-dependent oxidoreductase [Eggerthellaceae bacterium]|nr:molybdopterin-dependent oxidoreductase [Eggerthellaceae bacterium]
MTQVDIHAPGVEVKKSACYFCHANCGVLAYVKDGDVIKIEGDPNYTNLGGLCCRGNIALKHVNHPARINHCLKRAGEKGENKWEQIPWDQGIREVAERLNQIKEESGAEAVATAGGTTRTDDYARRRFFNIFGSPNSFHNALLCWIPTFMVETCVSGWSPFETDLGQSRCVILWGMNPGASTLPGMHGYMDLQIQGLKVIVVDPRYSETAAKADLWLPLRPGSDTALALAMLHVIMYEGMMDFDFVTTWCDGFDELFDHMAQYTPEWAEPITWLPADKIREAAKMYAMNRPSNIQWGCTWDQLGPDSVSGSHARALMRAVTGNLDVPGGDLMPGPSMTFLTDEELECNELLPEEQKAKQIGTNFFKLTSWTGYSKVAECCKATWGKAPTTEWFCEAHGPSVFRAILTGDPYPVRALIVNATNPVSCYGDSKMTLQALKSCEFLVTVDYWMTTAAFYSDYIFPPAGALERPVMHTNYGATDSIQCSQRAIQPKFDRHDDYTFWKELGLACGQDPELWPWETEEDVYFDVIKPLGYPVESYDEFVETYRMFFPPQHFKKYEQNGFCTPSRKVELNSSILRELGYPGMPEYHGCGENEYDHPDLAKEYPITLTTGGQFMPYHHSEHFNTPTLRYLYPDPYFTIHPDLAEQYDIAYGDWVWIETRRGRIRMRANVEPSMDPRAIWCPRGWWFPERGADDPEAPFGCLQSNVNVLTSVDNEHCDPIGGSWSNRGLLCKIYKCTAADLEMKQDIRWSIPGSSPVKSTNPEEAIQVLPSQQPLAFDPIPWVEPVCDREVPEGLKWDWHRDIMVQPGTNYEYDEESGWLVNPKTKAYYDLYSGWMYDAEKELLLDEASGKYYDFERNEVPFLAGKRVFPGMTAEAAGIAVPEGFTWNEAQGYIAKEGDAFANKLYDAESGWMIGIDDGAYYDAWYGYQFDSAANELVDLATGQHYDMEYKPIHYAAGKRVFPGFTAEEAGVAVPEGFIWNKDGGYLTKEGDAFAGKLYDADSGWMLGIDDGAYYDAWYGWQYDAATNELVDLATGNRYDLQYNPVSVAAE